MGWFIVIVRGLGWSKGWELAATYNIPSSWIILPRERNELDKSRERIQKRHKVR
jgi:hypothetical protein